MASSAPKAQLETACEEPEKGRYFLKGPGTKLGTSRYILCKVLDTEEDENGLVRSVLIGSRPRDSRDPSLPYRAKDLFIERVSVQRLVRLCTADRVPGPGDEPVEAED